MRHDAQLHSSALQFHAIFGLMEAIALIDFCWFYLLLPCLLWLLAVFAFGFGVLKFCHLAFSFLAFGLLVLWSLGPLSGPLVLCPLCTWSPGLANPGAALP